jgi:hypothetical protein
VERLSGIPWNQWPLCVEYAAHATSRNLDFA